MCIFSIKKYCIFLLIKLFSHKGHHTHHRERMRGEKDRDHRHGDRDKDRGDRDHGRERNRDRDRDRDRSDRKEKHHRSGRSKRDNVSTMSREDLEIAEANALRAQLGLPPLRP